MEVGLLTAIDGVPDERVAGRFTLDLSDDWSFLMPSGGVLMSAALSAMTRALDRPAQRLVSATAVFATPVPAGPIVMDVECLRVGRSGSQVEARLWPGREPPPDRQGGLRCVATFVRDREGPQVRGGPPPDVPHWRACPPWPGRGQGRRFSFFDRFEDRLALGHTWSEKGWAPGPARYARWMRYEVPVKTGAGDVHPLAFPPVVDLMPTALLQALGPEHPHFFAPSLDLTVHVLDPSPREWLLVTAYGRRARAGIASCEVEVWDEDGRLLAFATQTMMIRGLQGRP